jgi:hypothetical protein
MLAESVKLSVQFYWSFQSKVRHSDEVFEALLLMADRRQAVAAKRLIDARDALVKMLELIVDLTD